MQTQFETETIKIWLQVTNVKGCNSFSIEKVDEVLKWLIPKERAGTYGWTNPPTEEQEDLDSVASKNIQKYKRELIWLCPP